MTVKGYPVGVDGADGRRPSRVMTALERAFELARSGQVSKVSEIVELLRRDRYDTRQLDGPALRRQLTDLIKAARLNDMPSAPTRSGPSDL